MADEGRATARLSAEAARWRKLHREARDALAHANQILLGVYLRERLADPTDFGVFVDLTTIVDYRGAISWTLVDRALDELLATKPHLAAHRAEPWAKGSTAVEWLTTGT